MSTKLSSKQVKEIESLFALFSEKEIDWNSVEHTYKEFVQFRHLYKPVSENDIVSVILYIDKIRVRYMNSLPLNQRVGLVSHIFRIPHTKSSIDEIKSTYCHLIENQMFPHEVYASELAAYSLFYKEYTQEVLASQKQEAYSSQNIQSNPTHHGWIHWLYEFTRVLKKFRR